MSWEKCITICRFSVSDEFKLIRLYLFLLQKGRSHEHKLSSSALQGNQHEAIRIRECSMKREITILIRTKIQPLTRWISTGKRGTWFAIWTNSPSVRSRLSFFNLDRHWRTRSAVLFTAHCLTYFITLSEIEELEHWNELEKTRCHVEMRNSCLRTDVG